MQIANLILEGMSAILSHEATLSIKIYTDWIYEYQRGSNLYLCVIYTCRVKSQNPQWGITERDSFKLGIWIS